LVVRIISQRADYVVIGSESRTLNSDKNYINDTGCKITSLGGDTLFFATGAARTGVYQGKSWTPDGTARSVYKTSRNGDALSLSNEWLKRTLRWFESMPEGDLRSNAEKLKGNILNDGFINFDSDGRLSDHAVEIDYNFLTHKLDVKPTSPAPGETVISGVARDLASEFLQEKTERAIIAFGPYGAPRFSRGVDPNADVNLIQKAIKFAMDNAVGEDKLSLGGDIDVAIIRKDRTIEWVARKSSCRQQDLQPIFPTKH